MYGLGTAGTKNVFYTAFVSRFWVLWHFCDCKSYMYWLALKSDNNVKNYRVVILRRLPIILSNIILGLSVRSGVLYLDILQIKVSFFKCLTIYLIDFILVPRVNLHINKFEFQICGRDIKFQTCIMLIKVPYILYCHWWYSSIVLLLFKCVDKWYALFSNCFMASSFRYFSKVKQVFY